MSEIVLTKFEVGMAIKVMYITPDNGRPTMNLKDDSGNIILSFMLTYVGMKKFLS